MLLLLLVKHRRQLVTDKIATNGKYRVRRLTPNETWRLMGCKDNDFLKASQVVSNTSLYKQAGNSIVVNVLEAVFRNMFMSDNTSKDDVKLNYQFNLF